MTTNAEMVAVANAVAQVSIQMKQAQSLVKQTIDSNQAQAIDWTSQPAQDALTEAGVSYSAADVSNALGSMQDFDVAHWATHGVNYQLMTGEHPIV